MDNDLSDLLRQHIEIPFPTGVVKGDQYGLVNSVMIGADIYGWASRVAAGEDLPEIEQRRLMEARDELLASLDAFPPEARPYYELVARVGTQALRQ